MLHTWVSLLVLPENVWAGAPDLCVRVCVCVRARACEHACACACACVSCRTNSRTGLTDLCLEDTLDQARASKHAWMELGALREQSHFRGRRSRGISGESRLTLQRVSRARAFTRTQTTGEVKPCIASMATSSKSEGVMSQQKPLRHGHQASLKADSGMVTRLKADSGMVTRLRHGHQAQSRLRHGHQASLKAEACVETNLHPTPHASPSEDGDLAGNHASPSK